MGANSAITWTDHTFNPWRGCQKVAAGCTNCYAESMSKRNPKVLGIWGKDGSRVIASESMWKEPVKWNAEAADNPPWDAPRVFCASLADVFEDWGGMIVNSNGERLFSYIDHNASAQDGSVGLTMNDCRKRLFNLIDATPNLDWLLLTKRPENIRDMWPRCPDCGYTLEDAAIHCDHQICIGKGGKGFHRPNVWLGTSIATQEDADANIPHLLKCRDLAPILFLSCEPLIEEVELSHWLEIDHDQMLPALHPIHWVICGAESGHNRRPMKLDWARSLRDQCAAAEVPFFMKQLEVHGKVTDDVNDFPADLQVQQFPRFPKL